MKSRRAVTLFLALLICLSGIFGGLAPWHVSAAGTGSSVSAKVYEFGEKSNYEFSTASDTGRNPFGSVTISGDISQLKSSSPCPAVEVNSGNVKLSFSYDTSILNRGEKEWHVTSDNTKKVDTFELKEKIRKGAVIVQISQKRQNWITVVEQTNILTADSKLPNPIYTTEDINLTNGCFYRVIFVYQMEMMTKDNLVIPDEYAYKKVAEIFEFYASYSVDAGSPQDTPRKTLGEKVNTGKNNGFSGNNQINKDDIHYGWNLGSFFVNGYTQETTDSDNIPVFLKNVGDRVTLWFTLEQDINKLNGNEKLKIYSSSNNTDQLFEPPATNFKHGALIIRYTDHQGVKHDPVLYTNFLEACTSKGANTKVQLFEEGDYEVALDYEVESHLSLLASQESYRIFFRFKIRNGNCMVFPFDVVTGNELAEKSLTENGFKLDMARSRYLEIFVSRAEPVEGADGLISEDTRFNRPAKDGESYKEQGIYTFEVKNKYTGSSTTKTIYVGSKILYKALSNRSTDELNALLKSGQKVIDVNGAVVDGVVNVLDAEDGKVLEDKAVIKDGFSLEMPESKYISANLTRMTAEVEAGGTRVKLVPVTQEQSVKNGNEFMAPGIYTISTLNGYTNEQLAKTIYVVGTDRYLKALASMSLEELNQKLELGATVDENGAIVQPTSAPTPTPTDTSEPTPTPSPSVFPTEEMTRQPEENAGPSPVVIVLVVLVVIAGLAGVAYFVILPQYGPQLEKILKGRTKAKETEDREDGEE